MGNDVTSSRFFLLWFPSTPIDSLVNYVDGVEGNCCRISNCSYVSFSVFPFSLSFFCVVGFYSEQIHQPIFSLFRLHVLDQTKKENEQNQKEKSGRTRGGQEKATLLAILPPIKRDRDYWNTTGYCGEEVVKCYLYMNSATKTRSPSGACYKRQTKEET